MRSDHETLLVGSAAARVARARTIPDLLPSIPLSSPDRTAPAATTARRVAAGDIFPSGIRAGPIASRGRLVVADLSRRGRRRSICLHLVLHANEVHEAVKSTRTLWSNKNVQVRANNNDYGAAKGRAMPRWHSLNVRAVSSSLSRRQVCHMSWFEEANKETPL